MRLGRCSVITSQGAPGLAKAWQSTTPQVIAPITAAGWVRVAVRSAPLGCVVFGGLLLLLVVRLFERPIFGLRRPVTPFITLWVCRAALLLIGIRHSYQGVPLSGRGAIVANHSSWLDIFALNAVKRIYFVAKAEVAGWPGIGWLAQATGTVFIRREREQAKTQVDVFKDRLKAGHKLLFFPEGTTTDGQQVLPFKPTLFAAFFDPGLAPDLWLQPVTVSYEAPAGADARFYGWWGDTGFGPHLLAVLAQKPQGAVHVHYHDPVALTDFDNRKQLARYLEDKVREGLTDHPIIKPA